MSDYISEEVLIEILKRLPVKSLAKYRCVSKSWYSLITSANFISLHITHSIETNKTYPLVRMSSVTDKNDRLVLCNDDDSFSEYKELDLPINHSKFGKIQHSLFEIVGSCNGLVCVSDHKYNCMYVWNPAIKESVTIFSGETTYDVAFGFDSKKNEYKVVRIVYDYQLMAFEEKLIQPLVQIYELSSNVWRTISVNNVRYVLDGFGPRAYLNGVAHWFANLREEGLRKNLRMASFDFGDEEFGELMLPDALANWIELNLSLSVCGQLLAMIQYGSCKFDIRPIFYGYNECCSIWVMKEYGVPQSWSKLFTVNLQNHGGFLFVLSFRGNGEVLLEKCNGELTSYNPKTQRIKSIGVRGASKCYKVHSFVESLLSPKGLKKMLGKAHSANYQEGASVMVEGDNEIERTKKLKARIEE